MTCVHRGCRYVVTAFAALSLSASTASAQFSQEELNHIEISRSGRVTFSPTEAEQDVPELFRQAEHRFPFETEFVRNGGPVAIHKVRFPSPIETEIEVNNTVHAEYYQPAGEGPFPGVIVLHILGGDFPLSQAIAQALARKKVAALFIKMPYYGERRSRESSRRMISKDPRLTVEGMQQAVADIRRGCAWLAERPEVNSEQLGVTGISLGGIMSALSAAAEPRFRKVAIYLGGGDLGRIIWDLEYRSAREFRSEWLASGGTKESFLAVLKPVDPITYGELLKNRQVLMVNATDDEIIPREATLALWKAAGEPELIWLKAGHVSASRYIFGEVERLARFFQPNTSSTDDSAESVSQ